MTDIGIEPPSLLRPRGAAAGAATHEDVVLTPQDAGWTYCGLRVLRLAPGEPFTVATGESEGLVLPLAGSLRVDVENETSYELAGRRSVFTSATDFVYVGRDSTLTLVSEHGAEVALPSARCERRLPSAYGSADDVPCETRGAGQATRLVLMVCVPLCVLSALCAEAHTFFVREVESFNAYEIVRPEN